MNCFFGSNLQYLRKNRGLSQQALADALGFTRSKIASYENEKAEPNALKLAQIARFFNISLNELIEENLQVFAEEEKHLSEPLNREERQHLLENGNMLIQDFEERFDKLKKIAIGIRALYTLKKGTFSALTETVHSFNGDFENSLEVMDRLLELNEETILCVKKLMVN